VITIGSERGSPDAAALSPFRPFIIALYRAFLFLFLVARLGSLAAFSRRERKRERKREREKERGRGTVTSKL